MTSNYYNPITYIVPAEEENWTLKTILQKKMNISRRLLSRLKQTDLGITVNGIRQYIDVRVRTGDAVEVRMQKETSDDILPQSIPIQILYEDDHLLIVSKQANMIVHPTHGHYTGTLANGVVHYWQQRGEQFRFRPIHRLDQETSGVLAIAKNPYVHQHISEQMKANSVKKEYVALVRGNLVEQSGTIHAPIDRDLENPHLRIVTNSGYPATTHYEVIEQYDHVSFVGLRLETGRTHQIRVHMRHLGHPLIGDKLYGISPPSEGVSECATSAYIELERHALHAIRLGFIHPIELCWVEYDADIPNDMRGLIDKLKS